MYGGVIDSQITSEFWELNLSRSEWIEIDLHMTSHSHVPVSGHTAHVIGGKMHVIFGYNPDLGFINIVQECDLSEL